MADILAAQTLSEHWQKLLVTAKPNDTADLAAFILLAIGSAAYLLRGTLWNRPDPYRHLWFERPQLKNGATTTYDKATRNIAFKMAEDNKEMVIFWGSQSGTAEGFANRLARECSLRLNLKTMSADLSDYDSETIALIPKTAMVIFILSTFGEGDPSDNTQQLWEWIRTTKVSLSNLRYIAFGLGNSNYQHYNRVIDVVASSLDSLGAKTLMPPGKANDAEGATEEDFLAWKDELLNVLQGTLGYTMSPMIYQPALDIVHDDSLQQIDLFLGERSAQKAQTNSRTSTSQIRSLPVKSSFELFKSSERNCLHMELDISEYSEMRYKTGDHIAIWPINPEEEVKMLLRAFGLENRRYDSILVRAIATGTDVRVPSPTTVDALFKHYLDICGLVPRDTIRNLVQFAPNTSAKAFLNSLCVERAAYYGYLSRNHLTIGRLLREATAAEPSIRWPQEALCFLVEVLPLQQPRYYSISSSSVISPHQLSITALVARSTMPDRPGIIVPGLTSSYLQGLSSYSASVVKRASLLGHSDLSGHDIFPVDSISLQAYIRRSKFKLPIQSSTPLIMVAAGTGIAPFRAFIAERVRLKQMGKPIGEMVLFFGCRNPNEDFLYREEFEAAAKELEGSFKIITAFSRVPGGQKIYVQDRVREAGNDVIDLMENGASMFVCGRASMAREVGKEVARALQVTHHMTVSEARDWCETVKRRGKWREDVWG